MQGDGVGRVKKSILVLILLSGVVFISCSKQNNDENPTAASKNATVSVGEAVVNEHCNICHAQGVNGAPKLGDKAMWSQRASKGLDALSENAISGFGLMPPKGGRTQLTDDQVKVAVAHMLTLLDETP